MLLVCPLFTLFYFVLLKINLFERLSTSMGVGHGRTDTSLSVDPPITASSKDLEIIDLK